MEEWTIINDTIVILNAFYFKSDEENYMKITGYFDYTYIVYVFFDYLFIACLTAGLFFAILIVVMLAIFIEKKCSFIV